MRQKSFWSISSRHHESTPCPATLIRFHEQSFPFNTLDLKIRILVIPSCCWIFNGFKIAYCRFRVLDCYLTCFKFKFWVGEMHSFYWIINNCIGGNWKIASNRISLLHHFSTCQSNSIAWKCTKGRRKTFSLDVLIDFRRYRSKVMTMILKNDIFSLVHPMKNSIWAWIVTFWALHSSSIVKNLQPRWVILSTVTLVFTALWVIH